ncbi:MAG TPA: polysaccharide deacetylase family protein [Coriobacteriia bacterium]|jgi:peptidoglycan/xylan/chitin deacetylase (PgdA/CDA1 family)
MAKHGRRGSNRFAAVSIGAMAAVALLLMAGIAIGMRAAASRAKQPPAKAAASSAAKTATRPPVVPMGSEAPPVPPVTRPATDQVVPVLMYHHIMPNPNNFIAISPATFDQQMKWLQDNGYHAVSMAQLVDFTQTGRRLPEKPVLITFDDGRMNQLTYGVPILKKYGFTATFFVVKKWIDSPSNSFMHAAELRKLVAEGYDVESHTNSHTFIVRSRSENYALMKARLWGETNGMRLWLERVIGRPVTALAYPGGGTDKLSSQLVKEAGYSVAFTTATGFVRYHAGDPGLLPRWNAGARGLRLGSFVAIFKKAEALAKPKTSKPATRTP